jgi:hypothetical protein
MTDFPYEPARVRQLRLLLWVVVAGAAVLGATAVAFLAAGNNPVAVLLVLALPAVLMAGLAVRSMQLLARQAPSARRWLVGTAAFSLLVALWFANTLPGLLLGIFGLLLMFITVLPGRDTDPSGTDGRPAGR